MKRVGILALQGGYDPHLRMLKTLDSVQPSLVRTAEELRNIDALILPGGESTTIGKLLVLQNLLEPLRSLLTGGLPVFGTCAGMILLAKEAVGRDQPLLGVLDISVERNAYGRQVESFETSLELLWNQDTGRESVPAVFIRAPQVVRTGPGVEVLASYEEKPVLLRRGNYLVASFHPELTESSRIHSLFLSMV